MVQEINNDLEIASDKQQQQEQQTLGLVVGNYCHDVLFKDGHVISHSLGGATSFISNVLDLSLPSHLPFLYLSKVGSDFAYSLPHPPLTASPSSTTTLFHAHFTSATNLRLLQRIRSCDPILPSDLPPAKPQPQFHFGIAAAVAGEIPPETLARLLDLCRTVLVDVQGLIRSFDPVDGTVSHVPLRSTPFFDMLPRIGFLKASAEEAPFLDVEEVRRWCCVIVTDGKDGCRVYWKDGEVRVRPFPTVQVDPTGAGDSFLGGFVVGLVSGLAVPEAAMLGNFFGSITVGQIGVPKFDHKMLQVC